MDFRQNNQPNTNRETPAVSTPSPARGNFGLQGVGDRLKFKDRANSPTVLNLLSLLVLVGSALLILGAAFFMTRISGAGDRERGFVNKDMYQAVFLNNGQVYFGNVNDLNSRYVHLSNVYYLTQGATGQDQQQASDYTLVKLGCQQIHHPQDQMMINRDQVTFWENLSKDGKVAKSIEEFKKQNPNGENCKEVSNQTQSTSAPTQSSNNTTQSTTPTTNPSSGTNQTNSTNR